MVIFTTWFHRWPTLWNSMLKGTALIMSNVVHINVEIHNVDLTLFNIINSNVEINNVASTMTWRCPTSRRHNNQKPRWKQRWWNVCWEAGDLFPDSYGVSRSRLLQPYLVINVTACFGLGKIRVTFYLHLFLTVTFYKIFLYLFNDYLLFRRLEREWKRK